MTASESSHLYWRTIYTRCFLFSRVQKKDILLKPLSWNRLDMSLELIRALIGDDLTKTNCAIRDALLSPIPLIQQITEHILSAGGKRIRPIIALLSARALACHK